jgi:O-antigen/teichoic acid export membrane protein
VHRVFGERTTAVTAIVRTVTLDNESEPVALPVITEQRPRRRRSALRVYGGFSALQAATYALGFITAPIVARALGPQGRGLLAAIIVPTSIAPWVFQFGTGLFAAREAARGTPAGRLLGSVGLLSLAFGLLSAALAVPIADLLANGHPVVKTYLLISFATLPISLVILLVSDIVWGLERWGTVMMTRLSPIVAAAIGVIVLHIVGDLTVGTAAAVTLASSLTQLVPLFLVRRAFRRLEFSGALVIRAMRFGSKVWLGTLAQTANQRLDQLLMIPLLPARQLGLYAVAVSVTGVSGFASAPIASIALPRVAMDEEGVAAKATRLGLLTALGGSVVTGVGTLLLLPVVFTNAFAGAVPLTLLLLVASVFSSGSAILAPALAAADRPSASSVAEGVGLVVTVPGLLILLPAIGATGAAVTTIAAYAAGFGVLLVAAKRRFGIPASHFVVPHAADARWIVQRTGGAVRARLRRNSRSQ